MKCVESVSVCGSDLESVAMIQVFHPANVHGHVTVYASLQVSQKDFTLVKEITVQSEEPVTSEGWDEARKQRLSAFLYSPEAYAIEQELKSPCEDAVHQIMNCPVTHEGPEKTLGHLYVTPFPHYIIVTLWPGTMLFTWQTVRGKTLRATRQMSPV